MVFEDYDISAHGHLIRAERLIQIFRRNSQSKILTYASLELRVCIERLLFEYLVLIQLDEDRLRSLDNFYRTKDFKSEILKIEPEFSLKIDFVNIYLRVIHTFYGLHGEVVNIPNRIIDPDFELLSEFYGKLGNCLHSLKMPEKTTKSENWNNLVIHSVFHGFSYLQEIVFSGQLHFKMNDKGFVHYEVFKSQTLTEENLIKFMLADFEKDETEFIKKLESGDLLSTLFEKIEWINA